MIGIKSVDVDLIVPPDDRETDVPSSLVPVGF